MNLPLDIPRCCGVVLIDLDGDLEVPLELDCPRRSECLRYLDRDSGEVWLVPSLHKGQCLDRLTEAGYRVTTKEK